MPKYINTELTNSVTSVYGDLTKTFAAGRATQRTFGGKEVLSPALTTFADVQTSFGIAPGHCLMNPATGRKFEVQNVTTNSPTILAFTFDIDTGDWVYIGKIIMTLPLGTHSYRGFDFDDSNTSNIKIILSSTVTTALCQGGTFKTWNVALSDFTLAGTTIYMATSTNQKAVYFDQYSGQVGLNHLGTTSGGVGHGRVLNTVASQTKYFQQNGTAALPVIYGWDTSLGNPSVDGTVTNGIESKTTLFAGTSPAAFFSMGASQNGYSTTAPTAAAFEAVILQNGTTNIPSNFVASTTTQTLYYMRDLQLVGGIWYFNLSTTATGAAVTPATNSATFTMMRGNGITTSHSLLKTNALTPALTGTILQTNSFGCTIPTDVPAAASLNGEDCLFLATGTNLYLVKVSDISDGGTTWSSRSEVNLLPGLSDPQITTPAALTARHSSYLDRWVYITNTSKFVLKPHQNNKIDKIFGALSNLTYEAINYSSVPFGMAAIVTLNIEAGWAFITGSTAGQRGVIACDLWSDDFFGNTYLITKQLHVPPGSVLRFFTTDEASADFTGDLVYYIRSAGTASDPIFNTASGGWTQYFPYEDNSPSLLGPYFQVKIGWKIIHDNNTSPAQIHTVVICYDEPGEIDKNFTWCHERISKSGDSPMAVSVRQVKSLASAPTKFLLVGTDDAGNTVKTIDSSIDASSFECTSNSGTSYGAFTNMSNFMTTYNSSSGNTEIKVTVNSPPNPLTTPYVTWSFYYV